MSKFDHDPPGCLPWKIQSRGAREVSPGPLRYFRTYLVTLCGCAKLKPTKTTSVKALDSHIFDVPSNAWKGWYDLLYEPLAMVTPAEEEESLVNTGIRFTSWDIPSVTNTLTASRRQEISRIMPKLEPLAPLLLPKTTSFVCTQAKNASDPVLANWGLVEGFTHHPHIPLGTYFVALIHKVSVHHLNREFFFLPARTRGR